MCPVQATFQRKVAMLMTRGGRFDSIDAAWKGDHIRKAHTPALQVWNEEIATMRHSMTGERFTGCPTWYPTRLANGRDMREHFNHDEWPMLMTSYKSNLMSSMSIGVERLRQVHPHNPVSVNRNDAARLGIRNGDRIQVTSPGGTIEGVAVVRDGVIEGAIAVEHGYGHRELGARAHDIDGRSTPSSPALSAGVNLNDIGFRDPTRGPEGNIWIDWVSGAAVRQGLPVKIRKLA